MNFGKLAKNPLVLVGIAAAVYFLFFKKSAAPMVAAKPTAAGPTATGGTPDPTGALLDAGGKLATELIKFGTGTAKEALGVEGMGPVSLNGMVASVGGLGDLGGSFYGSY